MKETGMGTVGLRFGALVSPVADQLAEQGLTGRSVEMVQHWQADADAIVRLSVRGILPAGEVKKARKRLLAHVAAGAVPLFASTPEAPNG